MKKQIFALTVVIILLVVSLTGCLDEPTEKPKGMILYVDAAGGKEFISIQKAINNASDGDTIEVSAGNYFEYLFVNKSVTLKGSKDAIINPRNVSENKDSVIFISADNCTIQGFTIRNNEFWDDIIGIFINSSGDKIIGNTITRFEYGIYLKGEVNNGHTYTDINISTNEVSNCSYGIYLRANSERNIIYNNDVIDNVEGINLYYCINNTVVGNNVHSNTVYGIYININSDGNIVTRNVCTENKYGIRFKGVSYNEIYLNRLERNELGLYSCCGSSFNRVYKNTCIDNEKHASDAFYNSWDNGAVGNYWDDYIANYQNATKIGNQWSIPYNISDGDNQDEYPLVNPTI